MSLVLNEQQQQLQSTANAFFTQKAPVSALRKLRDSRDTEGISRELWREMAAMGWAGTFLPEELGGIDCGFTELGVLMQAAGRTLVASPLFATVALGASALLLAGRQEQRTTVLPGVASGDCLLALAVQEGPHHRPLQTATRAIQRGESFVLTGEKTFVADGHIADYLIVVARTSGNIGSEQGLSLFLVDPTIAGVTVERQIMADSRNMASVRFADAEVPGNALLGQSDSAAAVVQEVIDRGNIALAAEMLGSAQAAFERTLSYLKDRQQFGVAIGTFQALQHRAARMFCELELSKTAVLKALDSVDTRSNELSRYASLAKIQVAETLRLVSNEAIQMHGGIGMTDEEDVGFYLKRARVAQMTLGDENYHLLRFAALKGY